MPKESRSKSPTGTDIIYELEFVGQPGQYLNGVPAGDLTALDLMDVCEREGVTREQILGSGLYVEVQHREVAPVCGAPKADGGRCQRKVAEWGERCRQHADVIEDGDDGEIDQEVDDGRGT